jgi:hypothetical protein
VNAGLLNYKLHKMREAGAPAAEIAKVEARLAVAKRRELKRLARVLRFKADVYGPEGRIYGFDAPFAVRDGKLFHGEKELDPAKLRDGHGRPIHDESDL